MTKFHRFTRRGIFVCWNADKAIGGGATGEPKPETVSETKPGAISTEVTGETIEAKLESATGIISKLSADSSRLSGELEKANSEKGNLETQFNAATSLVESEKEAHGQTKAALATANEQISILTRERDEAKSASEQSGKNVARLEKLCDLKGVDHNAAVTVESAESASANSPKGLWEQHGELQKQEKSGAVAHGTAFAFYRKNKAAMLKVTK